MSIAIHWFRRDLRLTDNTALAAAAAAHDQIIPLYIVSTWRGEHRWTGAPRQEFLCGSLAHLAQALEKCGSRLIFRTGDAETVLEKLVTELSADAIYFNRDPDPFGRQMETRIAALGQRLGCAVHGCTDVPLHEGEEVKSATGSAFRVFTPYAKAWIKVPKRNPGPTIAQLAPVPQDLFSDPCPTLATWGLTRTAQIVTPGEKAGRQRLEAFLSGPVLSYGEQRNFPATPATSRLSQDLRYGTLSIREIYARCAEVAAAHNGTERRNVEIYINELIWRDFYLQVLWKWPEVLEHEFLPDFRGMKWQRENSHFAAWCAGQTGFPIVDAAMRQMLATGFMHNRARMIVAMFLTKDLHCDWRLGEQFFMQRLTDGEIASNNGGWQWSASTGTDAAPYFRIQNPWSQTKRFDPEGAFIKEWLPELRDVPSTALGEPPEIGRTLAKGYPRPIVDHAREREIALQMYQR